MGERKYFLGHKTEPIQKIVLQSGSWNEAEGSRWVRLLPFKVRMKQQSEILKAVADGSR